MKEKSEYEIEKEKKKLLQVRNEFYYHGQAVGKYEFPMIKKQDIDVNKIQFLSYVNTKKDDKENKNKTVHFFTYDWLFEKVYEKPDEELEKLSQYYCLLTPDFSMWTNMPLALQIESCFKNRWCGAYWQSKGFNVIPTVSWGDEKSFEFCFDGIEKGSIVAVCTYYRENDENSFILGYNEMLKRIKPSIVLCYDEPFKSMKGNIKEFLPTTYEWIKNLSPLEQARFKHEKKLRNVSALSSKDFKYFDYEDPYAKTEIASCPVCNTICLTDQYGNGECENCGWNLDIDCQEYPNKIQYPNIISLNKAKVLYKQGKKFLPTFDEFIEGLKMYSEMSFDYQNKNYGVFYYTDGTVEFFENKNNKSLQKFSSINEFKDNAFIENKLLKNIWFEVKNANYMQG